METATCEICENEFEYGSMYEYRNAISCTDCFDKLQQRRDAERQEVIVEENHKTDRFKGLDVTSKANQEILKRDIEIAKKESKRLFNYEAQPIKKITK